MSNIINARNEVIAELHALIDCFPVGETRHIVKAARYVQSGKMDDVLSDSGAASTSELAVLAMALARIR